MWKKAKINIKGITLVTLAIAIVVIMILAGVTINIVTETNGLIAKSKAIASNTEQAEAEAQLKINSLKAEEVQYTEDGTISQSDASSPTISSITTAKNCIVVSVNITETGSGLEKIEYSKDGGNTWVTDPTNKTAKQYIFKNLQPGTYTAKVRVYDKAGNTAEATSSAIEISLDTSDATATAEDIVKGKTAYVNGDKITGKANDTFLAHSSATPLFFNGKLYNQDKATINTYKASIQDGEYLCSSGSTGAGVYITNNSGATREFYFLYYLETAQSASAGTGQMGYGTGILPDMDAYGTDRISFTNLYDDTTKIVSNCWKCGNGYKVYISTHEATVMRIVAIWYV